MLNFPVSPQKVKALLERMAALGIKESDIEEKFIRGSGAGGQKINKTSSTAYLKHLPSGVEVKCQDTRQLIMNRYYARCKLCNILEEQAFGKQCQAEKERFKIRKQKARRSRRSKEKMLEEKAKRSEVKSLRKKTGLDGN